MATATDFLPVARELLCRLGETIRDRVLAARAATATEQLAAVAAVTAADTIYAVDKISEEAIVAWFTAHWPAAEPVEVVMEGLEEHGPLTFPARTEVSATKWKCILDPIDGTRNVMYDKRSAWALAGLAPQRGPDTHLGDIAVAAMTEIPISKQWRSDQLSAIRGRGVRAEAHDLIRGGRTAFTPQPSRATDFRHGFAAISRFFPEGKALLARIEEQLWDRLYGLGKQASPLVFDDQYICTGGQLYELAIGHDRMLADLRPLVFRRIGFTAPLTCHPYDICTALVLQEAGGIVEQPDGSPLNAPLDTTGAITWIGFANETLAAQVRPILREILQRELGG